MRRWKVRGADSSTGNDRVMSFSAASADEAKAMGNYNGLLVESVEPIEEKPLPPPPEVPVSSLNYSGRGISKIPLPRGPEDYGVALSASILNVFAVAMMTLGLALIAIGAFAAMNSNERFPRTLLAMLTGDALAWNRGFSLLFFGAATRMLTGVGLIVRDACLSRLQ